MEIQQFSCLWFYVKSILADLKRSKSAISTVLKALNFDFLRISQLKISKNPKNVNSELSKGSKWQFLGLQNDQNQFHVKSEWQNYPVISTLSIPNLAAQVCTVSWSFPVVCIFAILISKTAPFSLVKEFKQVNRFRMKIVLLSQCHLLRHFHFPLFLPLKSLFQRFSQSPPHRRRQKRKGHQ